MATATRIPAPGAKSSPRALRESWQERFVRTVARGTGLEPDVVRAWLLAEGGPSNNPLNIGPGRHYKDTNAAAHATVTLLHSRIYSGIIRAGRTGNERAQVDAIVHSPWDAGHYHGGTLLRGTLARVKDGGLQWHDVTEAPGKVAHALTSPITSATGGALNFVKDEAAVALAYVVLSSAAVALFVLGLSRISRSAGGPGISAAVPAMRSARLARAAGGDIPF